MQRERIEREVQRLAPWYYAWNLDGVLTSDTPPCDEQGHRRVTCPQVYQEFWRDKSVLDVACNEGAYGLGALEHGARRLVGFDCRAVNVEKARLVAGVLGYQNAEFFEHTCDSWIRERPDERFDVVMLCGILYHLPDPIRTIREYCAVAREWIYVTCGVVGCEAEGFSTLEETEALSASHGGLDSLMPNNADTLISAFREHGFVPVHVEERRNRDFWDGANLMLRNCIGADQVRLPGCREDVSTFLAPESGGTLHVAIYNRQPFAVEVFARAGLRTARGLEPIADERLELAPRAMPGHDAASASIHRRIPGIADVGAEIEVAVVDAAGGSLLGGARLVWPDR